MKTKKSPLLAFIKFEPTFLTGSLVVCLSAPVQTEGEAEGGCGGNSASPEPEAKPRRLLDQSRSQQKSFLFLLEEKIRRAQIRNAEKTFLLAGERQRAAAGRSDWFRSGISDKMSSGQTVKTHQFFRAHVAQLVEH
ncbi:MAG: hypothetical protein QMD77_04845 [Patescibacteria group bacterium]|nr:hypothetical protein [Patescibacteria group bacterium]